MDPYKAEKDTVLEHQTWGSFCTQKSMQAQHAGNNVKHKRGHKCFGLFSLLWPITFLQFFLFDPNCIRFIVFVIPNPHGKHIHKHLRKIQVGPIVDPSFYKMHA